MKSEKARPIALIGLSGAGKSAVASRVAQRLGRESVDLDDLFERQTGKPIAQWFAEHGEAAFRRLEGELLTRALDAPKRVVACGGGIVLDPANRHLLRGRGLTVWLAVSPARAAERARKDGVVRPLLAGGGYRERLEAQLDERAPLYAETAHTRVETDERTVDEVAGAVLEAVARIEAPGGPTG